jgi:hypothetical protein
MDTFWGIGNIEIRILMTLIGFKRYHRAKGHLK